MSQLGMGLHLLAWLWGAGLCVGTNVGAQANDPVLPGELVMPVAVRGAICAAVSDTHDLLVVGSDDREGQLSVFTLAGKAWPQKVSLPKPEALKDAPNRALGIAFHPQLPLLYVWQDITADAQPVHDGFDHLIIFAIDAGALKQVAAFGRGPEYAHGQSLGAIAFDPQGRRLFLPNLRDPGNGAASIGYFDLDDKGMPRPTRVAIKGTLDGRGLNEFQYVIKPVGVDLSRIRGLPTGGGFVVPSADVVMFNGAAHGPAVWDTQNRRAAIGLLPMGQLPGDCLIGADARLPVLFGATQNHDRLYRVAHADGYPTLMPDVVQLPGAAFCSAPVVIAAKSNRLAVGGVNKVHLVTLDKLGRFTDEFDSVPVENPAVRAMAYSYKSGRLYVAMEKGQL